MAAALGLVLLVVLCGGLAESAGEGHSCREDTIHLQRAAANGSRWALAMVDASARGPGAGTLWGHTTLLGAFDQCVAAGDGAQLRGRYCLAQVRVSRDARYAAASGRSLMWAWCSPSTCGAPDVQAELEAVVPEAVGGAVEIRVSDADCATAERTPLGVGEWAFVLLATSLGLAVIGSTAYDVIIKSDANKGTVAADAAWRSFSLVGNWRGLVRISPSGLLSVHGVKTISMAWVVVFHKYSLLTETPAINADAVEHGLMYDWTQMPVSNGGSLAVNSFLVVGGMLATLSFLKDRAAGRRFSLLSSYLHRYLRLTPLYAVVVFLYVTGATRLGSGPLWHSSVGWQSRLCQVSWWRNMLYINNFQPPTETCMLQSWYLSCDMQLQLLLPILLFLHFRWPKVGRILLGTVLLISIAIPFSIIVAMDLPWADARRLSIEKRSLFFPLVYAAPYTRAGPFLVGVVLGYILYKTSGTKVKLGRVTVWVCWCLSTVVSLTIIYSPHVFYIKQYHRLEAALFATLHPTIWAIIVAWVIFSCERGYAGPAYRLLSWWGWQPLSRLTYSVYLLHFLIFYYEIGIQRAAISYDHFFVFRTAIADVTILLILSAVFTLVIEMPILNLDRALFKPGDGGKPRSTAAPMPSTTLSTLQPPPLTPTKKVCDNPAFEISDESPGSPSLREVKVVTAT